MGQSEHFGWGTAGEFPLTQWSMILATRKAGSAEAEKALARLCQQYWWPVYGFIRGRGMGVEEAKDLTQDFFALVIEDQFVGVADQERGRFRTFLKKCISHFLGHKWAERRTIKRGGQYTFVPLADAFDEANCGAEPADEMSPDKVLDQRWAWTLLAQALEQLRQEYAATDRAALFETLEPFLSKDGSCSYAEAGAQLGLTAGAARTAACRMRSRYRELVMMNVAQTVDSPQDLEAELGHLCNVFSAGQSVPGHPGQGSQPQGGTTTPPTQ
jgi:DNA-directed RNA polymerase specialized sigma24 family protein